MLVRSLDDETALVIGQASHAWLSGQLARAWQPPPSPYEEVCLAALQHDVGMAHWDLAPSLNPATGRPTSFIEMALADHLRLWSLAPHRVLTQSRYAALLVSLHGTFLYQRRDLSRMDEAGADDVRAYLAAQRTLQRRLASELGAAEDELRRNQRLIFTWDALSLGVCLGWEDYEAGDVRLLRLDEGRFSVDPWPFAGEELVVRCEGRRLSGRFETEAALHDALEAAPRVDVIVALVPG